MVFFYLNKIVYIIKYFFMSPVFNGTHWNASNGNLWLFVSFSSLIGIIKTLSYATPISEILNTVFSQINICYGILFDRLISQPLPI